MAAHSQSVSELLGVETEYQMGSDLSDLRRKSERSEKLKIRKSYIESKNSILALTMVIRVTCRKTGIFPICYLIVTHRLDLDLPLNFSLLMSQ